MPQIEIPKPEYWERSSAAVVEAGEKSAMEAARDLRRAFQNAAAAIQRETEAFKGRHEWDGGTMSLSQVRAPLGFAEIRDFRTEVNRYISEVDRLGGFDTKYKQYLHYLSARVRISRQEAYQANMRHAVESLYRNVNDSMTSGLSSAYSESYMHTMFYTARGFGFQPEFSFLNPRIISTAIKQKWLGANYSDRVWQHKDDLLKSLDTTFLRGVAQGWNPRKMAQAMAGDISTKYDRSTVSNCVRLARTEFINIANQATVAAYKEYGVINRYMFRCTLDERTSKKCGELDGKTFPVDEAETGINMPPMHPNCRSTTIPDIDDELVRELMKKSERIAKDPAGKSYYVPSDMTYVEWMAENKRRSL